MSNPYRILNVPVTADDATIRAAYLTAIRDCPPEHDRQRFEQVRAAYEAISDLRRRLSYTLFDTTVPTLADVVEACNGDFQPQGVSEQRLRRVLGAR